MSIKKMLFIMLCLFPLAFRGEAQSLDQKENLYLKRAVDTFISYRDGVDEKRKTEFTIVLLEVDSCGKINSIHIMSDEKRRGKTYEILTQLQPKNLQHITLKSGAGKLIIFPVVSVSGYGRNDSTMYSDKVNLSFSCVSEDKNAIVAKTLYYIIPENSEGHLIKAEGSYIDKK